MEKKINGIVCKVLENEWDVYFDMALTMLNEIVENNKQNKPSTMIVPVGPTNQYPILANLVNTLKVSLKNVYFFNMDEYLSSPNTTIDYNDKMSFHKRMEDEFYSLVDDELVMPNENRIFPQPGKEKEFDSLIDRLGGIDLCLGGVGINGHIAFNEPEPILTPNEFADLGTRVLPVSRETKTVNAIGYQRGDLDGVCDWCVTVGMKQILSSRKIYIAFNRPWQNGPLKHALFAEESSSCPITLLRRNKDVTFCLPKEIAKDTI